jgi:signal transduction histidine kinase
VSDRPAPDAPRVAFGRQGLRFRVYLLTTVGVLAPAALVSVVSYSRLSQLDDEMLAGRRGAAVAVAEHLEEETSGDLLELQRLASSPQLALERERLEGSRALLRGAHMRGEFLGGMFLLDLRGEALIQEPSGGRAVAPPRDNADVQATLRDGKPRVTGLVGARDGRVYGLVPVVDWRGRPTGIVGAVLDPTAPFRSRVLRHLQRGDAGYAALVDTRGLVLASTDPAQLHKPVQCAQRLARLVQDRQSSVGRCRDCHTSGVRWVVAFAPIANAPWGVVSYQPEEVVLATTGQLPGSFVIFGACVLGLAVLFAWAALRSVTRPIALLTGSAERVAAGALDEPIPDLGDDELGRLGGSVEHMRRSLRDMIALVAKANQELEQRVAERTRELARANEELRDRDAQRQRLLRMVITAQEDERKRIARELHDETTQSLAVLTMGIETAAAAIRSGGPTPRLDEVKALAVRTLEEVHRLILDLRPAVLDDLGLFSALRWYAERTLGSRGIAVRCEIQELDRPLPPEISIALFRIGQEAMNNIARHAGADSVLIQLGSDGKELHIEIEDDGEGFDLAVKKTDRPHYGLLGINERAELLGGTARIESSPGSGTRVEVHVPLPPAPPGAAAQPPASPAAPAKLESEPA